MATGLDTVATVTINGQVVLSADNMFRTWTVPVKPVLVAGANEITVAFTSAVTYAELQCNSFETSLPDGIPPPCPPSVQNGFCHINFIRKEPCSFSWDWGKGITKLHSLFVVTACSLMYVPHRTGVRATGHLAQHLSDGILAALPHRRHCLHHAR